jgi:hypothetical protein
MRVVIRQDGIGMCRQRRCHIYIYIYLLCFDPCRRCGQLRRRGGKDHGFAVSNGVLRSCFCFCPFMFLFLSVHVSVFVVDWFLFFVCVCVSVRWLVLFWVCIRPVVYSVWFVGGILGCKTHGLGSEYDRSHANTFAVQSLRVKP